VILLLDSEIRIVAYPAPDEFTGNPTAPAHFQHLCQVGSDRIGSDDGTDKDEQVQQQRPNYISIACDQRIIKILLPEIDARNQVYTHHVERHDSSEKPPRRPAFFRNPEGPGERP